MTLTLILGGAGVLVFLGCTAWGIAAYLRGKRGGR